MVETRSAHVLETEPTPVHPATTKAYKEATEPTLAARAGGRRAPSLRRWHGLSDAQAYTAVALGHLLLAVPLIFSWKLVTKAAFGKAADPPEDQHGHLLHLYASALCSSAAVAFALEELARGRMLHTFTADTLKLGLIGHGIAWFTLFVNYPATWSFTAMLVETVACLATAGLPASQLLLTRQDRNRVWRDFRRIPSQMPSFFPARHRGRFRVLASIYAFLTIAFPLAGLAYFISPRFTLQHTFGYDYGKSAQALWKAVGVGGLMTVMPALTAALKHKAEVDMMAATPARTLNLGLMGTAVGHLLVLGPILAKGHAGFLLPGVLGTWGLALLASMLGLGAPEAAELADQVVEQATKAQ